MYLGFKLCPRILNDAAYLEVLYYLVFGKKINWSDPRGFNEKLQWLKIHDRRSEYNIYVDKYAVKRYVADKIGKQYVIPTLGVWENFDDIDFSVLPEKFVLKCTHDSGSAIVCHDKAILDKKNTRKTIKKCLKRNFFFYGREWPYKAVKPRIIAEELLCVSNSKSTMNTAMSLGRDQELIDYKMMCFNGKARIIFTCTNRHSAGGLNVTFYDLSWIQLPFERHYPSSTVEKEKPESLEQMISLAEKLAKDMPFVRIDFYYINGKIYFSEMTLYPGSGFEEFNPEKWDGILGDWIELPKIDKGVGRRFE